MKHGASYGAMPAAEPTSLSQAESSPIQNFLPWLIGKDTRWRTSCLVGTLLLFACGYVALLVISSDDCSLSSFSGESRSVYCKLPAWSLPGPDSWIPAGNFSRTTTSIDRIVFGVGASAGSWAQRSEYIKLWWKPGVTRGFVWVDETVTTWKEGDPPFKVSEDTSRFAYTHELNSRSALRIARIVSESFRLNLPNVDWFVMGDDDTLFFPDNLVHVLSKYDPTKMHYVGHHSEGTRQVSRHHYGLAFGGGGFAISYPLAKALSEIEDDCMERYKGLYGSDERVKACVSELGVPLTREPGFHQLDIHGDISGFLAAHPVAPVVSLHHLDEFDPIFPGTTHLQATQRLMKAVSVSSANVFQQSICYDAERKWSFSVAWGYVVEAYTGFQTPRDLEIPATTFISWAWRREFDAFTVDTRPLAPVCDRPTRFFMNDAKTSGSGSSRIGISTYDKLIEFTQDNCQAKPAPMDTIKTITVENDPIQEDWFENPRRQCCTVKGMDAQSVSIHVGVCGEYESLVTGRKRPQERKTRRILL